MNKTLTKLWWLVLLVVSLPSYSLADNPHFVVFSKVDVIEFSQYANSWNDPSQNLQLEINKKIDMLEKQASRKISSSEREIMFINMSNAYKQSPDKILSFYLSKDPSLVVFRLGITLPDSVNLLLCGPGALTFSIKLGNEKVIEVPDQGIVCIVKHKPADMWHDTRKGKVPFNNRYNQGIEAVWPNFVFALLPRSYLGLEVVKVDITSLAKIEDQRTKIAWH